MRYKEQDGLRILTSEYGKLLYDEKSDVYSNQVFLGKYASVDDYIEVKDPNANVSILQEINYINNESENQLTLIDTTMLALDEIFTIFEPLLATIPMTMSLEEVINPMVELYVVMVQRGLKTLEEIPARYRDQVAEVLEKVEE